MTDLSVGVEEKTCNTCPMKEKIFSILHWEKPTHSALILSFLLVSQISFVCFSAIQLFAYLCISILAVINGYRFYACYIAKDKDNVVMDYLNSEVTISSDRVSDLTRRLTNHFNHGVVQARDLFLFTNVGQTFKFAFFLYVLTIVGAYFNLLTLSIIATVFVFILPKFYDRYQTDIDRLAKQVKVKLDKVLAQITAQLDKLPVVGHRKQKEQ